MKIVNLGGKGTLLDQFLAEIRDEAIQLDRMRFRKNLARTANIFAYEISKALPFNDEEIQTPLGVAIVPTMKEQPVIASVLRAGLPMHEGFLSFFDHADSAFIAGYRKYEKKRNFRYTNRLHHFARNRKTFSDNLRSDAGYGTKHGAHLQGYAETWQTQTHSYCSTHCQQRRH